MAAIAPPRALRDAAPAVIFLMAKVVASLRSGGDREVLGRVAAGDARALRTLYDAHAPQVLALCNRILKNLPEAEEIAQEAFLEVWRGAAQYDDARGGAQAWLLTIARSRAIDRLRARDTARRTAADAAAQPESRSAPLPLELASQRQDRERIAAALAELPEDQRTALELAYFEGLTQSEVAERTGAPLGTVKTRMRLAMQKLAALLAEEPAP